MKKSAILFILSAVSLTSCGPVTSTAPSTGSLPQPPTSTPSSTPTTSPSTPTTSPSAPTSTPTPSTSPNIPSSGVSGKGSQFSQAQMVMANGEGIYSLPSLGDSKILVLPISIKGTASDCNSQGLTCQARKEVIEDAFFGERTGDFEIDSLTSFYSKSSYGKLNISGTVADWYTSTKTAVQMLAMAEEAFYQEVENILDLALEAVDKKIDLSEYDSNSDGVIDSVWMVYSAPIKENFWAFTGWSSTSKRFESDSLDVQSYVFASYDFLLEGDYKNPDTHTVIHETGHLLGLNDYYDYDNTNENPSSPLGGIDMMDYNIGDHSAYSKYLLGWIEPEILSATGSYTLDKFTTTGKTYLIPGPDYNGTALSEYYLVQYYTPDGLNDLDSKKPITPGYPTMYTSSGLLIYHVDNRIAKVTFDKNNEITALSYVNSGFENLTFGDDYVYVVASSNSPSQSYLKMFDATKYFYQVEFVSAKGNFTHDRTTTNSDLFRNGNGDIGITKNLDFKWNQNGQGLGFTFQPTGDSGFTFTKI